MKLVLEDQRTTEALMRNDAKCSTAAFFFHDRGGDVQTSFEGLVRSIIHQILSDIPELKTTVYEAYKLREGEQPFVWTVRILGEVFDSILKQDNLVVSICLFLDALDEYDGDYARVVDFLRIATDGNHRSTKVKLEICFSSRLEQKFLDSLLHVPGFQIHEHTTEDIARIVDAKFRGNPRMLRHLNEGTDDEKLAVHRLRSKILSLAEGVFLWVRLILDELLDEFTYGKSLEDLCKLLVDLPTDLDKFCQYLVEKRISSKYIPESRVMFELVECALRPLVLSDFLLALQLALIDEINEFSVKLSTTIDEAKRLVGSRSGGLIEIRSTSTGVKYNETGTGVKYNRTKAFSISRFRSRSKTRDSAGWLYKPGAAAKDRLANNSTQPN